MDKIFSLGFYSLLSEIPILLAWITGIVLALVFWKRHPKVSLLTLIAIIFFFLLTVVNTFLYPSLSEMVNQHSLTMSQVSVFYGIYGITTSLLTAGLWGLLLGAIFSGRKQAKAGITPQPASWQPQPPQPAAPALPPTPPPLP